MNVIPDTGPATVSLHRAAEILGIGQSTAYELARRGEFPVPVLMIGRSKRVALVQLERYLNGTLEVAS